MVGSMFIVEIDQKTKTRFRNVDDFETFINAIEVEYDGGDVIFTRWLHKLNTPQSTIVNRSENGRGTDFKQDIVEYIGKNCSIPTSGNCFIKCIKYLSGRDFLNKFSTLIRDERRGSNVMTSARIQPFCKKYVILK